MKKIGFIGLGNMGAPIAANLVKAGYKVFIAVHSNRKPAEALAEQGAVICSSYEEVASNSDTVFTIVPDAPQVEEVIFGENGLLKGLKSGCTVIDMSTIDLTRSQEFAKRLKERNINMMDAPVSGGPKGAAAGTMAIMAGGDRGVFDDHMEVFNVIGGNIVYCGANGMGLAAKMANNLIAASQIVAISEALSLAIKAGVDPDALYEVLKGGTASSVTLNAKVPAYLRDDYAPGFKLSLMCKDLNIITTVAKKIGTPTMVGGLVEQIYRMCIEEHGEKDSGSVSLFYQKQTGVSFKSRK